MKTTRYLLILLIAIAAGWTTAATDARAQTPRPKISPSVDRPGDSVRAELQNGRVRLIAKKDLGWPSGRIHFVEGLEGRCVGLFVGNIGLDTDPFLCMLMDDGGVEIISHASLGVWSDFSYRHFTSSGRLPGLKHIVGFHEDTVVDGPVCYCGIFATDRDGGQHEIKSCSRPTGQISHQAGDRQHLLLIYPDWTMKYIVSQPHGNCLYEYFGRLRSIKRDYKNNTFDYRYDMLTRTAYPGESGAGASPKTSPCTESGSFRMVENEKEGEWDYDMTVLSGTIDFGTKQGSSARYKQTFQQ